MSGRYDNHKGSSRSTRDDSRQYKDVRKESRDEDEKRSSRSRSRSPRRRSSPARSSKYTPPSQRLSKQHRRDKESRNNEDKRSHRKSSNEWEAEEEEVPAPPPPPRITPISIGFAKPKGPIKMSLGGTTPKPKSAKPTVASVFNDDDDEPEEMPAEARMRMRNIGRETPTSAGPNSFGKTKQGFCDAKKVFEKNLKNSLDTVERPAVPKFAQTIYKIKPTS